jgi:bacillithiol synthase
MPGGRLPVPAEQGVTAPTIVRTLSLGGGPLTAAALDGSAPSHWYAQQPGDGRAWAARIEQVRREPLPADWLGALWPAIAAYGPAADRLRNAAAHGVVVTTGQQPGLFGGPMYTWSKAIGVLALADAIERATGIPVAPLFWAATDDTDFAEASTTWVASRGGATALTAIPAAEPGTVLAGARLGDLSAAFEALASAAGSAPYAEALDAVRAAYAVSEPRPSPVTAGHAYVALLRRILEPLGVAVIDASHAAVRTSAMPVLVRALERADVVAAALAERSREIAAHGYTPQVSDVAALSLVFEWSGLEHPAHGADGAASNGDAPAGARKTRIPLKRAAEAATRAPVGALSGNVLLRPVVERSIVPTVAYLGGPGEIAYFAQTGAVAAALGVPAPLVVPRWSCSLLEPAIADLMERHGITEQALRDAHGPEGRLARAALPAALRDALTALRAAVDMGVDDVAAADPASLVSGAAIEGARVHLRHRVARLERRYLAAAKQTSAAMMADVATVRGALRPNGTPQERALNFIPFLARGGPALVEAMRVQAARHASALVGGGSSEIR